MSKGLEELEKLGNEYPSEGDTLWSQYSESFSIIEKELKDYEETKKELKQVMKDYQDLGNSCYKELKALEIIKRTALKLVSLEDDTTICRKGRYAFYDNELYKSEDLTKEEYDLLKEVLK